MSDNTRISYGNASWNIVAGCTKESPGCMNCWAVLEAWRMFNNPDPKVSTPFEGVVLTCIGGNLAWTGKVNCLPQRLATPLHWRKPRRILVAFQGDLFHSSVPDQFIADAFAIMAATPQHTYLVLTKRTDRAHSVLTSGCMGGFEIAVEEALAMYSDAEVSFPLPNVLIGATVEDQQRATERLLGMQGIARFGWRTWVSHEPGLDVVDWKPWTEFVEWGVAGGEKAAKSRPMPLAGARGMLDAFRRAGRAFDFKQWGDFLPEGQTDGSGCVTGGPRYNPRVGAARAGRLLDGVLHNAPVPMRTADR